jgi:hypothetical protein
LDQILGGKKAFDGRPGSDWLCSIRWDSEMLKICLKYLYPPNHNGVKVGRIQGELPSPHKGHQLTMGYQEAEGDNLNILILLEKLEYKFNDLKN